MPPPQPDHSRRVFLRRAAAAAAGAVWVGGCRRSDDDRGIAVGSASGEDAHVRPPLPPSEPVVRVRVLRSRDGEPITIGLDQQWLRLVHVDGSTPDAVVRAPVSLSVGPEGWDLVDDQRYRPEIDGLTRLTFTPMERRAPDLAVGDTRYAGSITVVPRTDQGPRDLDVVNHVRMEQYLPGVLSRELYASWSAETFAAQAIAARSFACVELSYFSERRHFDVTNTASSQVYGGRTDHDKSRRAVKRTEGQVLSYENRLVSGYYSSCCGGLAAAAIDAIGRNAMNEVLPLRGRAAPDVCNGAPVYGWTVERPLPETMRRMRRYGDDRGPKELAEIGRITTIDVAETNAHGRPTQYLITDVTGTAVEIGAERLRWAVNHADSTLDPPERALWSSFVKVTLDRNVVTFEGNGYGHGVGLCQYGAQALADRGIAHRDIIDWYYPGARIEQAYG